MMKFMSNLLKRAYNRFEEEVESDKYSIGQRLAAAALGATVMIGGVNLAAKYEIDERILDGIASLVGNHGDIDHYDG